MPDYHTIPISTISVSDRFRKDYGDIKQLADSIKARSLLHPIVVSRTDPPRLLAGGRRLRAVQSLGWTDVPVHYIDEIDDISIREIELEENICRQDLLWPERCALVKAIHELKLTKYGQADSSAGGRGNTIDITQPEIVGWSQGRTAEITGMTRSWVSRSLRVAEAAEIIPSIKHESSLHNAERKIDRLEDAIVAELERRKNTHVYDRFSSSFIQGDCTSLVLSLDNESIDCIIVDPPYGYDLARGRFAARDSDNDEFDDSPEAALALLRSLAPQLRRVLRPSGHLYAFFGASLWTETITIWRNAGFDVDELVNIWVKTGGATGAADWDFRFAPSWEPFIFATNHTRRLAFKHKNTFMFDAPSGPTRVHPTQKPVELIRELIQLSTQPGEIVLDPCAGSASTLVAASQLRRKFIGYELNPTLYTIGLKRLVEEGKEKP